MNPTDRSGAGRLPPAEVVLCSACLLGVPCRYDGTDRRSRHVEAALDGRAVVPICPEVAGGLAIPRSPADLLGGDGRRVLEGRARVVTGDGVDVTAAFRAGAERVLAAALAHRATVAVLKEGSPSCGVTRVRVDGAPARGLGVTAAALDRAGLAVLSDEQLSSGGPFPRPLPDAVEPS